jgi:hypothetical protein
LGEAALASTTLAGPLIATTTSEKQQKDEATTSGDRRNAGRRKAPFDDETGAPLNEAAHVLAALAKGPAHTSDRQRR